MSQQSYDKAIDFCCKCMDIFLYGQINVEQYYPIFTKREEMLSTHARVAMKRGRFRAFSNKHIYNVIRNNL